MSCGIFGGTLLVRLNMEISKSAVLFANEHQSDQKKNATNDFRINFRCVFAHAKKTLSLECQKM